jgi:hypothetical protein
MKLKVDEDKHVVVQDDNPVYVHDDGTEAPFDARSAVSKINALTEEKDRHWKKKTVMEKELEALNEKFEGVDPDKAREALETIEKIDQKKLIDAGQVDTLKAQMQDAYNKKYEEADLDWTNKESTYKNQLTEKDQHIYKLLVSSQFAKSPWFTGESPKTNLDPEIAEAFFGQIGRDFLIENQNGKPVVIGLLNGQKIYSKERPGEPANFEEAIATKIEAYPGKDKILKGSEFVGARGADGNLKDKQKTSTRFVDGADGKAFADNLEDIASGKVVVKAQGT